MPRIVFLGSSRDVRPLDIDVPAGGAIVDLCDEHSAPVPFSCRSASCGTCRIIVVEGAHLLAEAEDEELQVLDAFGAGPPTQRLACQAKLLAVAGVVKVRPARDDE